MNSMGFCSSWSGIFFSILSCILMGSIFILGYHLICPFFIFLPIFLKLLTYNLINYKESNLSKTLEKFRWSYLLITFLFLIILTSSVISNYNTFISKGLTFGGIGVFLILFIYGLSKNKFPVDINS